MHLDRENRLKHKFDQHFAMECPHCQVLSHLSLMAAPKFDDLMRFKPKQVGIVYRCDSCNSPVFLRFPVRSYGSDLIEFSPNYTQIERAKETFEFTYLPEEIETLFREALICYSASCFNAFASMCRRTARTVFADVGEVRKLKIFDELNEIQDLAEIDDQTFSAVQRVLFDLDDVRHRNPPTVDTAFAGVLLEIVKDMLYQTYVRKGKLQQSMLMRKFFVEEVEPVGDLAKT